MRDALSPFLYVSYVVREFRGENSRIQLGSEMTITRYQLQDHRERACKVSPAAAATPAGAPVPHTPPAAAHPRSPRSAWPGANGPCFPVLLTQRLCSRHLRPNCAGAVFVRRAFSPRGEASGPRNRCLRSPVELRPAARPPPQACCREGWQLASGPPPCLPSCPPQGGGGLLRV